MTHILLASIAGNFANHLKTQIKQSNLQLEATYITTAANVYDDKPWMEDDIRLFEVAGFNITRADFAELSENECQELLNKTQILIIGGGNPIYLLEVLQEKSLIHLIKQRVEEGMIYVGSSAGAVIAAPDISLETNFDDRPNPPKLNSYQALNLINILTLPHWGKSSYKSEYLKMIDQAYDQPIPIQTLSDTQAVQITNGKSEIIEAQ